MNPTHVIWLLILATVSNSLSSSTYQSKPNDLFLTLHQCKPDEEPFGPATIRLLYDVNPSEGFNLRRDVYLRLAVFIRKVSQQPGWSPIKLVLPPFRNLYHWHHDQESTTHFWNHFFHLPSLAAYTDVQDLWQFFEEPDAVRSGSSVEVVQLRNFEDMFENGRFVEKFRLDESPSWVKGHAANIMGYSNLTRRGRGRKWHCRYQGSVMKLQPMLEQLWTKVGRPKHFNIFLLNAEVVLHDGFGDAEFWRARRSMRFATPLVDVAHQFRRDVLGEDGQRDLVQRPVLWQDEMVSDEST